ncbi:UpxY family transcription antiterminator [Fulvivirga sediminis]|uniref:UpxY family transcription antiterminator n=1 Tax=Fulvivirga sediminis TaxID=2803949 RepID=A0A937F9K6_9BACT|nr:UpxY family transcription antiterminator [Fulvivirga sediminis]MBL3657517.1 UpxY family transcription antiterminator [Fulvivirga sediminis]
MYINKRWYVLYTMPNAEKNVRDRLLKKNLEVFLPLRTKIVQRCDRKKKIQTPLFPGYVFTKLKISEFHDVYEVSGFLRFLSTNGKKDVVPDEEIETIKVLLRGEPSICAQKLELGENVKISNGPFAGLEGQLMSYKGEKRLIVLLNSIQQSVMLEIGEEVLECSEYVS